MKALKLTGKWWIHGRENEAVPGSLLFKPNQGCSLVTRGSLLKSIDFLIATEGVDVILGVAENGQKITLVQCLGIEKKVNPDRENYYAHWAFCGQHLPLESQRRFKTVHIELLHLRKWFDKSGLRDTFSRRFETDYLQPIQYDNLSPIRIKTNGLAIALHPHLQIKSSFGRLFINEVISLRLQNDEALSISDWLSGPIGMFQSFLSHAANQFCGTLSFEAVNEDGLTQLFFAQRCDLSLTSHESISTNMRFRFGDIENSLEPHVHAWNQRYLKLQPLCTAFWAVTSIQRPLVDIELFFLLSILEGYDKLNTNIPGPENVVIDPRVEQVLAACPQEHKTWLSDRLSEPQSFASRLKRLFGKFDFFDNHFGSATHTVVKSLRDTRNKLGHGGFRPNTDMARRLLVMRNICVALFNTCMLCEMGFNADEIAKMFEHDNDFIWAAHRINWLT